LSIQATQACKPARSDRYVEPLRDQSKLKAIWTTLPFPTDPKSWPRSTR